MSMNEFHTYRIGFTHADGTSDETELSITPGSETELLDLFATLIYESDINLWHLDYIDLVDDLDPVLDRIVDFCIRFGTTETTTGNYHVTVDDIASHLPGVSLDFVCENAQEIAHRLDLREEVIGETWLDATPDGIADGFDIIFGLDYCPNIVEDEAWSGQ